RQVLHQGDAEVDRREVADPQQRPRRLEAAEGQLRGALEEAHVVGAQHPPQLEVLELRGHAGVDHLHHLVGGDPVGQHRGDEGAGAGADVDVEVVDRAVDGEQIERPQRPDLVDAAGESAPTEDQSRLRRLLPPPRFAAWFRLDVYDLTHYARPVPPIGPTPPLPCPPIVFLHSMRKPLLAALAACIALLLALAGPASAAGSCAQMKAWLTAGGGSSSGLMVMDAETGEVLCAQAADTPRPLASNTKLFTTSAALALIGPETRIPTRVMTDGTVDANGVLHGSLYLQGGGDPTLGTP